jgi:hypothetical protein
MAPLASVWTTSPVVVSASTLASRTSTPVILLISRRRTSQELRSAREGKPHMAKTGEETA